MFSRVPRITDDDSTVDNTLASNQDDPTASSPPAHDGSAELHQADGPSGVTRDSLPDLSDAVGGDA